MQKVEVKDIDEGAYLWCQGLSYAGCRVEDFSYRRVVWFSFEWSGDAKDLDAMRNKYRNGEALVEPKTFASKQFELRKIVREKRDN